MYRNFVQKSLLPLGLGLLFLLPSPMAFSQASTEEVIREVTVQGNRRREKEAILQEVQSKPGEPLDYAKIKKDIIGVYELGLFSDVQVDFTDGILTFIVKEKPSLRSISVQGNDKITDDKIEEVVEIKTNDILDVPKIKKTAEKVRELYLEKGFFLAEVDYQLDPKESGDVDLTFVVNEHAKVVVRKITFVGNQALNDPELKSQMATKEGGFFSFINGNGTYKEDVFQRDLFLITAKYWDEGYIQAAVGEPKVTLSPDKTDIYVTIVINEGPRFKVGNIGFKGDLLEDEEELAKKITMEKGQWFKRSNFADDVQKLTSQYRDIGYAYANVTPRSFIHADTQEVDLTYEIQKGNLAYFNRIYVKGNTRTRDKVVRRELKVFEGDLFSESLLAQSRLSVLRLGFFESVNVTTNKGPSGDTVDVYVEIKEKPTGTFQVGAGFSTLETFIATAQVSQNNLFGRGQSLGVQAQLSARRQLVDVRFFEPRFLDSKWTFAFNTFINELAFVQGNEIAFLRNAQGGDFNWGYRLNDDWRVAAGYSLENVRLQQSQSLLPDALIRDGITSSLQSSVTYDTRDNRLFTSSGWLHTLSAEVSNSVLGADIEFTRVRETTRYFYPIYKSATPGGGVILKFNARFGYIVSGDQSQDVPVSERFFVGGINSVRGFDPRSLGPKLNISSTPGTPTQEVIIGGTGEFVFNSELEFPILDEAGIRGVLFADAGNAFGGINSVGAVPTALEGDFGFLPVRTSVGFGFRWFSPIGPLRFEWGVPLDPKAGERPIVFEFTIGNFF